MNEVLDNQALAVKEAAIGDNGGNGAHAMVPTVTLPISNMVSNEDLIAEDTEDLLQEFIVLIMEAQHGLN